MRMQNDSLKKWKLKNYCDKRRKKIGILISPPSSNAERLSDNIISLSLFLSLALSHTLTYSLTHSLTPRLRPIDTILCVI